MFESTAAGRAAGARRMKSQNAKASWRLVPEMELVFWPRPPISESKPPLSGAPPTQAPPADSRRTTNEKREHNEPQQRI